MSNSKPKKFTDDDKFRFRVCKHCDVVCVGKRERDVNKIYEKHLLEEHK